LSRIDAAELKEDSMVRFCGAGLIAALLATAFSHAMSAAATPCQALASVKLPEAAVKRAEIVPAGGFHQPGSGQASDEFTRLPSFCRVTINARPSSDSDIAVEVWLPVAGWNGKFQAVGNGSWGGTVGYPAMARALADGYATSSTDTGHTGPSAAFALGHPEKLIDYAYRSEHVMTVEAKAIIDAFYGAPAKFSYWNGCSTGGRQALMEAARFPDDFDGIIAGAAANPKTHLDAWRIWMAQAMFKNAASVIPVTKFALIHRAVLDACDATDGLADGLIDDPRQCRFDPQVLQCRGGDGAECLTADQVATARVIMSPAKDKRGAELFPGFEAGTELGWERMLSGPGAYDTAVDQFKYVVFNDPNWNWRTFDLERDVKAGEQQAAGTLSSIDPNLTAFAKHGGKLLLYHGWSDPNIAPRASVNFYTRTIAATTAPPGNTEWVRLFMVPGMGHCSGGEGPNTFDMMQALAPWVEKGTAPQRVVATRRSAGRVERSRPLCAYPEVARFNGAGSIDDAANFSCTMP
jgi:feruloyl esterase